MVISSKIVREIVESGTMKYEKGEFLIWDMPGIILPMNNFILINYIKEKYPKITMNELYYQLGEMQAFRGTQVMIERFGFEPNIQLIKDSFEKSELTGQGLCKFLNIDMEKKEFDVINEYHPYAHHYVKLFGLQKEPVCHFLRGCCCGGLEVFFKQEMLAVEVECLAKGDPACVFKIKLLKDWDMNDPLVKRQAIRHRFPKEIFEEKYSWHSLLTKNIDQG